jgi:hypothetical protein
MWPPLRSCGFARGVRMRGQDAEHGWYVLINGRQFGPLAREHLVKLAQEDKLRPEMLVWRPGFENWVAIETLGELFHASPAPLVSPSPAPPSPVNADLAWISVSPEDRVPNAAGEDAAADVPLAPATNEPAAKKRNYFVRHWRGELSLPVSYWLNGFLGSVLAVMAVAAIEANLNFRDDFSPLISLASVIGIWAIIWLIILWQVVGTWRSATNYSARNKKVWGRVAQLFLVLGVIRNLVDFCQSGLPQIGEMYDIFNGDKGVGTYAFRVLRDGQELEFSGGITFGAAKEFERFLDAMGGVRTIHLNSIGGRILEAQRMGNLIRRRNLNTYVSNQCLSACTIVFLSGRERLITAQARLGFHQPDLAGITDEQRREFIEDEIKRLRSLGMSQEFAVKANQAPPDDMWFPPTSVLLAEKAATQLVNSADFALSGIPQSELTDDSIEQGLLANDMYAAIRKADPQTYRAILERFTDGVRRGKTISEMRSEIYPLGANLFQQLLPHASDDNLVTYTNFLVHQLSVLKSSDPSDCYYAANAAKTTSSAYIALTGRHKDLFAEEDKLEARILAESTGKDKHIPREEEVEASLKQISTGLQRRFGDDAQLLSADNVAVEKHRAYCEVLVSTYAAVLKLPRTQAVALLRYIYAP